MIDTSIVTLFLISVLGLGIWSSRNISSFTEYSIANRKFSTPILTATLFATVIGGGSTYGLCSKVYANGAIFILIFYGMAINKLLVARFIAPKIEKYYGCLSISEVMAREYGKPGQILTGIFTILVSVGSVGSQIFAFGHVLNSLFDLPLLTCSLIGAAIIMTYSALGGVKSVVYTDVLQYFFILIVIPLLAITAIYHVDFATANTHLTAMFYHSGPTDENVLKFSSLFFILLFGSLDPSYIQRLLMSKNKEQAIKSNRFSGYLSFLHFSLIGMVGLSLGSALPGLEPTLALPTFINELVFVGAKGLIVCSLLAAVMSSADSDLHIIGVTFVNDILKGLFGFDWTDTKKVQLARISTFLLGFFSFYIAHSFESIVDIMSYAFSFWMPTILISFAFALYNRTTTVQTFIGGIALSALTTLLWNLYVPSPIEGAVPGTILHIIFLGYMTRERKELHGVRTAAFE